MAATELAEKLKSVPGPGPGPGSGAVRLPAKQPMEESQRRRRLEFDAPQDATREDAMHPSFWANVAKWLRRHDILTLLAYDQSWELELVVETVRQSGVDVRVRKNYPRTPLNLAGTPVGENHRTEYRAGDQWCVIRKTDGHPEIRGYALESSAVNAFHREQPKAA